MDSKIINLVIDSVLGSFLNRINYEKALDEKSSLAVTDAHGNMAHKVRNILLLGSDDIEDNASGPDVLKLISMDYTGKTLKVTSLEKDLEFKLEGNSFTLSGLPHLGMEKAVPIINLCMDLNIYDYVKLSFKSIASFIDMIGGIEINGENLDGMGVLDYLSTKYEGNRYVLTERQKKAVKETLKKLKNLNPLRLYGLADDVMECLTTDLTMDEIEEMVKDILSFNLSDIKTYEWPVHEKPSSYTDELKLLHEFIFESDDYKPSDLVKKL